MEDQGKKLEKVAPDVQGAAGSASGTWIELGLGREYLFIKPGLRVIRLLPAIMKKINAPMPDGVPTDEHFDAAAELIAAALSRNYTAMTKDVVLDLIDFDRFNAVLLEVLGAFGLRKAGGEAGEPGEAIPAKEAAG